MELKTKITAEDGRQEITITRDFELPVVLLFKAYTEAEFVAQWMGTNVLQLDSKPHGAYRFETVDAQGNAVFRANGVIHEFVADEKITRTFEMENTPFPVQLEFLDFEAIGDDRSRLTIHTVYRSVADRDALLKLPFAQGLNGAHNRLENIFHKSTQTP